MDRSDHHIRATGVPSHSVVTPVFIDRQSAQLAEMEAALQGSEKAREALTAALGELRIALRRSEDEKPRLIDVRSCTFHHSYRDS